MKKIVLIFGIIIITVGGSILFFGNEKINNKKDQPLQNLQTKKLNNLHTNTQDIMQITSSAFENNTSIPTKYTCDGDDLNPQLSISDVPEEAKSLVLIVDDPDAPVGLWVHWLLWNIGPDTKEIAEDSMPLGVVEGTTSYGNQGYGGPCPPDGEHRYFFKIYALDIELNLSTEDDKEMLEEAMIGHVIDKAELIGLYNRQ